MHLPVYVINLQRSQQRLDNARQQLQAIGVEFSRIDAVDGQRLTEDEISAAYDAKTNRQRFYAPLSLGEIACYMSHQKSWRTLLESDAEAAVVLEDDILVSEPFAQLDTALAQMPEAWDLLKLAQPFRPKKASVRTTVGSFQLVDYHQDKPPMGACGYIISRQGAKKLLSRQRFFRPVDVDMQWQWETGCDVKGLLPYCVDNTHQHGSDIIAVEDRHLKDKSAWRRVKEKWRFFWQNRHFYKSYD